MLAPTLYNNIQVDSIIIKFDLHDWYDASIPTIMMTHAVHRFLHY